MSTPLGIVPGSLPILLIYRSPDICQDLAAEALALGFAAGHEPRGGRDDGDADAAEHARHLGLPRVDAKAALGDEAQASDGRGLADVLHAQDVPSGVGRER